MDLRPYQNEAVLAIENEWSKGNKKTLLVLPTGCHARGEQLLLADGRFAFVEDIEVGDRLLGSDGKARTVLHTNHGFGTIYMVTPIKGKSFFVTGDHKLTLVKINERKNPKHPCEMHGGEIVDVTVEEWLSWSKNKKSLYKLFRSNEIKEFPDYHCSINQKNMIDPYFLGVLLGDGSMLNGINVTTMDEEVVDEIKKQAELYGLNLRTEPAGKVCTYHFINSNGRNALRKKLQMNGLYGMKCDEKHVPYDYRCADIETRLQVIAGLIDTDGSYTDKCYDFISKSRKLAEDLAFMCKSVGLAANVRTCLKSSQSKITHEYFRVCISGDIDKIPCRVAHKKAHKRMLNKSVLRTGFTITPHGEGDYFGFTVDGDNRYLMNDFMITHNCGKTIVFSKVVENEVDKGEKALILAHRGELLDQASDKLYKTTGLKSSLEKAESTSIGSNNRVTVASVQTLSQDTRLKRFKKDAFDVIVVDEAHHAMSETYQRVLNYFDSAKVLGVTATPDRADQKSLGQFFNSKAYEYTMHQAVKDGYLCPIKAQMIPLELDIRNVGLANGDYSAGEISTSLEPYLNQIALEMLNYCKGRKTVVFLPLVKTSQKFCELLNVHGLNAVEVNGNSKDREQILADFEAGEYDVLCNSMLLTEGWDCPAVDTIVVLRPTKVRSLYQQMVGRGMRLSPGKKELLLLDFLWMTERHDLCRPSAIISKNEDIAKRIDKMMMNNESGINLLEAEEKAGKDIVQEREDALARQLADMKKRKRKLVDPLQYAMSIAAEDLADYEPTFAWEYGPITDGQRSKLEKLGINPDEIENCGKASLLITKLINRIDAGLSTPKQIRALEKYGFYHVGEWSFEAASKMISRIAANNWLVPFGIDAKTYQPA